MNQPTIQQFKQWCRDCRPAAIAVCEAMAFAQCQRKAVDSYILPLFKEWEFSDDEGKPISDPQHLYRCNDEPYVQAFFKACDEAHRKHGFKGPEGHCPALTAEHLQIIAENALLDLAKPLFGIGAGDVYLDDRRKMLDLLIGACVNVDRQAA